MVNSLSRPTVLSCYRHNKVLLLSVKQFILLIFACGLVNLNPIKYLICCTNYIHKQIEKHENLFCRIHPGRPQ